MVGRPAALFDRDDEWRALTRFVEDPTPEPTLGIVSGRRRQGKSFLLDLLCEATGGFFYEAIEGSRTEQLDDLGRKLAVHIGAPAALSLDSWDDAVDALLAIGADRPVPVVLDEVPYLIASDRSLPSVLQRALGPRRRRTRPSRTRLLLCGSALRVMGGLLSGAAPLRGRAGLELTLQPFDHRTARTFWGIEDARLALRTFAVVGGTPAYRRELARDDVPRSARDFDAWVCRTVLDPSSPLFREARVLLAEEATLSDLAVYHSVLAAIAAGDHSPSRMAGRVGRPLNALAHPLTILTETRLVERHVDALHRNRTTYEITEPLIRFHHAVMRPAWADLERGRARAVWQRMAPTFEAQVLGPTFQSLCREHVRSTRGLLPEPPDAVERAQIADPDARTSVELDVVARTGDAVALIGEAKWGGPLGPRHLDRLDRARELVGRSGRSVDACRLALFSASGFTSSLQRLAAARRDVLLVDATSLYDMH